MHLRLLILLILSFGLAGCPPQEVRTVLYNNTGKVVGIYEKTLTLVELQPEQIYEVKYPHPKALFTMKIQGERKTSYMKFDVEGRESCAIFRWPNRRNDEMQGWLEEATGKVTLQVNSDLKLYIVRPGVKLPAQVEEQPAIYPIPLIECPQWAD